jgi:hypothetical protein
MQLKLARRKTGGVSFPSFGAPSRSMRALHWVTEVTAVSFTIVALNAPPEVKTPEKETKQEIEQATEGKIIGWCQGTGVFERPWST